MTFVKIIFMFVINNLPFTPSNFPSPSPQFRTQPAQIPPATQTIAQPSATFLIFLKFVRMTQANTSTLKAAFKKAFRIFKYAALLFTIVFWVWMLIDDYVLYSKHWRESWAAYLSIWSIWYFIYLLVFAFYYWVIASAVILITHYIKKRSLKKQSA